MKTVLNGTLTLNTEKKKTEPAPRHKKESVHVPSGRQRKDSEEFEHSYGRCDQARDMAKTDTYFDSICEKTLQRFI